MFYLAALDRNSKLIFRLRLHRGQVLRYFTDREPVMIAIEACATAHYWGRNLQELDMVFSYFRAVR